MRAHIITCIALFFFSCGRMGEFGDSKTTNVEETDARRAELGIRQIKPNWMLGEFTSDEHRWGYPSAGLAKKLHFDKSGREDWEEDYYYSGARYLAWDNETEDFEMISVLYDYSLNQFEASYLGRNIEILKRFGSDGRMPPQEIVGPQAVEAVDASLLLWGQSRL